MQSSFSSPSTVSLHPATRKKTTTICKCRPFLFHPSSAPPPALPPTLARQPCAHHSAFLRRRERESENPGSSRASSCHSFHLLDDGGFSLKQGGGVKGIVLRELLSILGSRPPRSVCYTEPRSSSFVSLYSFFPSGACKKFLKRRRMTVRGAGQNDADSNDRVSQTKANES